MLASTALSPGRVPAPATRKRGAQPRNHNARTHGFYSTVAPHATAAKLSAINVVSAPSASALGFIDQTQQFADGLMDEALDLMSTSNQPAHRLGSLVFDRSLRVFMVSSQRRAAILRPARNLVDLAEDAGWPIDYRSPRVPEYPLFVPLRLGKSDANLPAGGRLLTDAQWLLVGGLLDSLQAEKDARRKYGRRKPLPSARHRLRGILIKLAYGLRWRDLRRLGFPARPCRELHRQLRNSGRMAAIYTHLRRHLIVDGDSQLEDLVAQGCFSWASGRISLSPGQHLTWQKFTALLLLQRAQQGQRKLIGRANLARRRRGAYLRFPGLRISTRAEKQPAGLQTAASEQLRQTMPSLLDRRPPGRASAPDFVFTPILEALFPRPPLDNW